MAKRWLRPLNAPIRRSNASPAPGPAAATVVISNNGVTKNAIITAPVENLISARHKAAVMVQGRDHHVHRNKEAVGQNKAAHALRKASPVHHKMVVKGINHKEVTNHRARPEMAVTGRQTSQKMVVTQMALKMVVRASKSPANIGSLAINE